MKAYAMSFDGAPRRRRPCWRAFVPPLRSKRANAARASA